MSDKFKISKTDHPERPWYLEYSDGFDEFRDGRTYPTFDDAADALVEAINRRCITCDRGAVVDTLTGWECTACGSYDVAVGCVRP
jgi:hypothetical protein